MKKTETLYALIRKIDEYKTRERKVAAIRDGSFELKTIMQVVFSDGIKLYLPDSLPEYKLDKKRQPLNRKIIDDIKISQD